MKAFDEHGNESAMSAPYRLEVPAAVEGNNFLPTPLVTMSTMSGDAPLAVEFTAAGSTDFDGVITSYFWEFGDGSSAVGANVSGTYRTPGSYPVKLTVMDDNGGQTIVERVITVMPGSQSVVNPIAEFNVFPQNPTIFQAVWFSGLASTVSNGNINRFLWGFGDGIYASGAIAFHRYLLPGIYRVTLTVWDEQGVSSQKSFSLTVSALSS